MIKKRYIILRDFIGHEEQQELVKEALDCHFQNSHHPQSSDASLAQVWRGLKTSSASLRLQLGIDCGGNLDSSLPMAVSMARKTFQQAIKVSSEESSCKKSIIPQVFASETTPLTGLALLYGPNARMNAHYDSPTQPLQREEWLAMMTIGSPALFRLNDELITINSGDVLVMDSMATLHGVEKILPCATHDLNVDLGLPIPGSRLGILVWQGRMHDDAPHHKMNDNKNIAIVDGVGDLFGSDDSI